MGCLLYELAVGKQAFATDLAVHLYRERATSDILVPLDDTLDKNTRDQITRHITRMFSIEPLCRPSSSILLKEFSRNCLYQIEPDEIISPTEESSVSAVDGPGTAKGVKAMEESRITISGSDKSGHNLHWAAARGNIDVTEILLEGKTNVEAQDETGKTALLVAAAGGHTEVVKMLLDASANVAAHDANGWTALHMAARRGKLEVTQVLLNANAKIMAEDQDGCTAIDAALDSGDEEVMRLLFKGQLQVLKNAIVNSELRRVKLEFEARYAALLKSKMMFAVEGNFAESVELNSLVSPSLRTLVGSFTL